VGTIGAFHKANIDLTRDDPPFDFLDGDHPVFTRARYLGSSRVLGATVDHSLLADGCSIGRGSVIENSVIGVRARIGSNVTIRNTYVMGADFYETADARAAGLAAGRPPVGIGDDSRIENAIIDKNARIGRNVRILNQQGIVEAKEDRFCAIQDGIVVIPKFTVIPDGTAI
jgi:glucose-1-phosphate adenylyltransferase